MKYIKKFNSHQDYENYKGSTDSIRPLLARCVSEEENHKVDLNYTMSITYNVPNTSVYKLVQAYRIGFMNTNIDNIYIDGSLIDKTSLYNSSYNYSLSSGEHIIDYVFNKDSSGTLDDIFQGYKCIDHAVIPDNFNKLQNTFAQSSIKTVELGCNLVEIYSAFQNSSLTSIVIPNNINNLYNAFYNCYYLEDVVFGSSLNTINSYSFQNCSTLQNITFRGNYLKSITGYYDFAYCKFNNFTLPTSITNVSSYAFEYCSFNNASIYLQNLINHQTSPFYTCAFNNLYIDASIEIPSYFIYNSSISNITFGSHVKKLNNYCISNTNDSINFNKISFPKNITEYNSVCLYNINRIDTLEFQDGAIDVSIDQYAFGYSKIIKNISIGNIKFRTNSSIMSPQNPQIQTPIIDMYFIRQIVTYDTSTLFINMKETGSRLLEGANNSSINVSLGPNVEIISSHAFCDWDSSGTLVIPSTVKVINHNAFYSTTKPYITFENQETLEYIGNTPFYNNKSITTFTLGPNLKYYGVNIFKNSSVNKIIYKTKHLKYNPIGYNQVITGENSLEYYIESFIGNNLPVYRAIASTTTSKTIKELEITNTVEYIPPYIFYSCLDISTLTIPESVVTIDEGAFQYNNVSILNLPQNGSLKTIGKYAFSNLDKLEEINIPASVETIDDMAFDNCYNVSVINFAANSKLKYIGNGVFKDCYSRYLTDITIPDSVEILGTSTGSTLTGTFYHCYNLTNVHLGSGLKEIGSYCFYKDDNIESLIIPDNVEIIHPHAIHPYTSMLSTTKYYELTVGAHHICSNAFYQCNNTSVLTLTDSVQHIESSAFINIGSSTNLFTEIHIPKNVRCIEPNAFIFNHNNVTKLTVDPRNKWYKSVDDNKIVEVSTNNIVLSI